MKSKPKASRKSRTAGELNPRQRLFVSEYSIDQDGQAAAIRAGYSAGRAKITAGQLLDDPGIAAAIANGMKEREGGPDMTVAAILHGLQQITEANIIDFLSEVTEGPNKGLLQVDPGKASRDQWAAVREFIQEDIPGRGRRTRIKLYDKTRAIELLGKHKAMWTNKTQVEHSGKVEIEHAARELDAFLFEAASTVAAGSASRATH
jgi:phage terminase small subunit